MRCSAMPCGAAARQCHGRSATLTKKGRMPTHRPDQIAGASKQLRNVEMKMLRRKCGVIPNNERKAECDVRSATTQAHRHESLDSVLPSRGRSASTSSSAQEMERRKMVHVLLRPTQSIWARA